MMQSFLNECVSFCVNARSRNRINDLWYKSHKRESSVSPFVYKAYTLTKPDNRVFAYINGAFLSYGSLKSKVSVRGFVVHNQFTFSKEKAVRLRFVWSVNHFLLLLCTQLRELVDILPLICTVRNAEGEVKFVLIKYFSAEEVFFN